MYRVTQNNTNDLKQITDIYNDITGRNRTQDLHRWEWFESPYKNRSYVIIGDNDEIIGHHGILTVNLNYQNNEYVAGKTENTIMKKEYGPLYFNNEKAMHKDYIENYSILITTAAHGVTTRIRKKLGYEVFSEYITFIQPIDVHFLLSKVNNRVLQIGIRFFSPLVNAFIFSKKINTSYSEVFKSIESSDMNDIERLYTNIKNNYGFSLVRSQEFLTYKLLKNPYLVFSILKLYKDDTLSAYLIFYVKDRKIIIEDILYTEYKEREELLNRLFNYIKDNKLGDVLVFIVLKNSILDSTYKGFFKREASSDKFMIKNNLPDEVENDLKIENFYFTKLMLEGVQ